MFPQAVRRTRRARSGDLTMANGQRI